MLAASFVMHFETPDQCSHHPVIGGFINVDLKLDKKKSSVPGSKSCSNKSKVLIFPEIPAVRPGLVST